VTHQHLYGLTFRLCWPLASRRIVVGRAQEFWEPLLSAVRPGDALITSPSHLSRLGGLPPLPRESLPSIVTSAGAPLCADAAEDCQALFGRPVHEFFGSTETGVVAHRVRDGSAPPWRALPGVGVRRLDDGRLHVQSPYSSQEDGMATGDLIEIEATGFQLRGRLDRIAKIEGVRVSLTEFETKIAELSGVAQAAVVVLGGNNPELGAAIMLDADGQKELQAAGAFWLGRRLRRELARILPAAALPRRWRFVQQLPEGPIGKSSARDLAALFDPA
jgi:acyl-coenzyme A synthetase/AMP-(fatty) acid ligase